MRLPICVRHCAHQVRPRASGLIVQQLTLGLREPAKLDEVRLYA